MACTWTKVPLGSTGLMVSPIGLGSSYGIGGADMERAFERGINFFCWNVPRRDSFGDGLRRLSNRRDRIVVAVQTYTRVASMMEWSLDRGLRAGKLEYADFVLLGWWNHLPPRRILDAALRLKQKGKARHVLISGHNRPAFRTFIEHPAIDSIMVRYNAAHPGAETDVFPHLARRRTGVCAYTATSWGQLLDRKRIPQSDAVPRASDCYRFVLSEPSVDTVITGPRDGAQLDEAMAALDRGPLAPEELSWMRRVGKAARDGAGALGRLHAGE